MAQESPAAIIYDNSGNALAVQNATAIPASTSALLSAGSDGTNALYLLLDSVGRQLVAGAGVAGTPAGGVLSIQGVASGTPQPISGTITANVGTTNGLLLDATLTARINTLGQKTMANSTPVVLASDQASIPVTVGSSTTAAVTSVASSITSVTVLALNASRKGCVVYNDSTKTLYLKFGTTASTIDFTAKLLAGDNYEVPFNYSGRIDGIWAAANGSARVTELT